MAILLENATVVAPDKAKPVLLGQSILIDRGAFVQVGKRIRSNSSPADRRIDCTGMIVMPGLINAHAHLTEILQKSFRDNARMEIWRGYRSRTEDLAHLTAEEIGAAATLACAEMLKAGVTAVVDHFSTRPGLTVEKMAAIIGAFEKTGIRGILVPSLRDQDSVRLTLQSKRQRRAHKPSPEPWKDEVLAMLARLRRGETTAGLMLGPSSPMNCSDNLLRDVVRTAEQNELGIHTHLLETRLQAWGAHQVYGKSLCAHLADIGFLSDRLSTAHGVWLTDRDIALLARAGASVVHNPSSNLKLGSGIAPVAKLTAHGINVALGTDGGDTSDAYSIFDQMRLAAYLSRVTQENPAAWITAVDALRMATVNGAHAMPHWRGKLGRIAPGYRADLVLLKPSLRLQPLSDIVHQLVFCENGQSVDTVLVDGKIVVEHSRLVNVDEASVIRAIEPLSRKMARFYARVKGKPDPGRQMAEQLYKKSYMAKELPQPFVAPQKWSGG
jgi:cytosine/adenosine deaminase-related metal-dependent hydrolase